MEVDRWGSLAVIMGITGTALTQLINAISGNQGDKSHLPMPINKAANALSLNTWNGLGDFFSFLGDTITRPLGALANLIRGCLNISMNDESSQRLVNQMFQVPTIIMPISWAISSDPNARENRRHVPGFLGKAKYEIKYMGSAYANLFKPQEYNELWRNLQRGYKERGLKGIMDASSKNVSKALVLTSFLSFISSGALALSNFLPTRRRTDIVEEIIEEQRSTSATKSKGTHPTQEKNLLEKLGWIGVKIALSMLTFSYLLKTMNRSYRSVNGVNAVLFSGLTFISQVLKIPFADDPRLGQITRIIADFFSRLEGMAIRNVEARSTVRVNGSKRLQ